MNDTRPKTTKQLIKHLKSEKNIIVKGKKRKRTLINQGYYHGYKGYRFFGYAKRKLPIKNYGEIDATIKYDTQLKTLFYDKIMFIETALKNVCLDVIINSIGSADLSAFFDKGVESYSNCKSNKLEAKIKAQERMLSLRSKINQIISLNYAKRNVIVTHFYNQDLKTDLPLWAVFEILMMGEFGLLANALTYELKDKIEKILEFDIQYDPNRDAFCKSIFILKDLRNSIAHNGVVYDCRFKGPQFIANNALISLIKSKFKLQYLNFKDTVDYLTLICFWLCTLKVNKNELLSLINKYEKLTISYMYRVGNDISSISVNKNWKHRTGLLKRKIGSE